VQELDSHESRIADGVKLQCIPEEIEVEGVANACCSPPTTAA
jgi:hypothetical protein